MEGFSKFLVLTACLVSFVTGATPIRVGSPAPPIAGGKILQAPTDASIEWQSLRGKVVVLDFWATWCGPCVDSIPHWNDLVDTFRDKPVQFIAITDENVDVVKAFIKRNPIHSWISADDLDHSTRDVYGIEGIPTTIIVNQNGTVVAVTHPASLEAKHIDEILQTQKSSLPPPKPDRVADDKRPAGKSKTALEKPLFQVLVRKSDPHPGGGYGVDFWSLDNSDDKITGQYASLRRAIIFLFNSRDSLLDCRAELPTDYTHDFTVRLPPMPTEDRDKILCAMFHSSFGLKIHREPSERTVFVMKVVSTNAPGLVRSTPKSSGGGGPEGGGLKIGKAQLSHATSHLEGWLHRPIIDETGLTNKFDIHLHWKMSPGELLPQRLGYEFFEVLEKPNAKVESKLPPDLHRLLDAYRGQLSQAELKALSADELETISFLHIEMSKPEDDRFDPDPATVIAAVREQWGIALTAERRTMSVIVVEK